MIKLEDIEKIQKGIYFEDNEFLSKVGNNLQELCGNYFINSLPRHLIENTAVKAAKQGYYLYVYAPAERHGAGLWTSLIVVYTTESVRHDRSYTNSGKFKYDGTGGCFRLKRARLCKTERGSLYKFLEQIEAFMTGEDAIKEVLREE